MATTSTLRNDIKKALGDLATDKFDTIIDNYILAGKMDLKEAGIIEAKIVETDALIYSALISFVLSMMETYEYRELNAECYALQKDQLRHYKDYIS